MPYIFQQCIAFMLRVSVFQSRDGRQVMRAKSHKLDQPEAALDIEASKRIAKRIAQNDPAPGPAPGRRKGGSVNGSKPSASMWTQSVAMILWSCRWMRLASPGPASKNDVRAFGHVAAVLSVVAGLQRDVSDAVGTGGERRTCTLVTSIEDSETSSERVVSRM